MILLLIVQETGHDAQVACSFMPPSFSFCEPPEAKSGGQESVSVPKNNHIHFRSIACRPDLLLTSISQPMIYVCLFNSRRGQFVGVSVASSVSVYS